MADIPCAKCGEPWDSWELKDDGCLTGYTKAGEGYRNELFRAGKGCPSCGWGKSCVSCGGTGKAARRGYGPAQCTACHDTGRLNVWEIQNGPSRNRYPGVHFGYLPEVGKLTDRQVEDSVRLPSDEEGLMRHDNGDVSRRYTIRCPFCWESLDVCGQCAGSGKFGDEGEGAKEGFLRAALLDSGVSDCPEEEFAEAFSGVLGFE